MTSVLERIGVPSVINAAGKLTALGGSAQDAAVANAQAEAAQTHVELKTLRDRVASRIAELSGADAATVTSGAAAGIAIAVAACITGDDLERVHALPETNGLPNGVLLQAGHDIDFGAPVVQMIRLGGGRARVFGTRERVTIDDLDRALGARAALTALLYVQSHHCLQHDRRSLEECVDRCHAVGLPVIVDASAEEDLRRFVASGADLVTYSGGKSFGGPTSGFIVGRRDLVVACELQQRGIARAMKVGKEQIAGLFVALERYTARDSAHAHARDQAVLAAIEAGLAAVPGISVERHADEAGRAIERIALRTAGDLAQLIRGLAGGNPSIRTRNHHLADGYVLIDPREIDVAQARTIVARIRELTKP